MSKQSLISNEDDLWSCEKKRTMGGKIIVNLLVIFFSIITNPCSGRLKVSTEVKINSGTLRGEVLTAIPSGQKYASFKSIPYAEPPIGHLRFKPPLPKKPWTNVLDATKKPPKCPQLSRHNPRQLQDPKMPMVGQENCLYLNVYIPILDVHQTFDDLPVMVFVHGGAFIYGDGGTDMYGPDYFMAERENPVILVTMNYRLGVLGFLSLDDDVIYGNMGLKDQVVALKWVKDNIRNFGGNSDKVTIFGESAGGISVMSHILSPWSKGLFNQAIVQSGPVYESGRLQASKARSYYANKIIDDMNSNIDVNNLDSEEKLKFLQDSPIEEIVKRNSLFEKFMFINIPWVPSVDLHTADPFFPKTLEDLLREGVFNKVPIITGAMKDDGTIFLTQFLENKELVDEVEANFDIDGSMLLLGVDEDSVTPEDFVTNVIRKYFLGNAKLNSNNIDKIGNMFSMIHYLVHTDIDASLLANKNDQPVYYYQYQYHGKVKLPMFSFGGQELMKHNFGVCHADELFLQFRQDILGDQNEIIKADDLEMSKKLISLWTTFAANGDPGQDWPRVGRHDQTYAVLDADPIRMESNKELSLMNNFFKLMMNLRRNYKVDIIQKHPMFIKFWNDIAHSGFAADTEKKDEL